MSDQPKSAEQLLDELHQRFLLPQMIMSVLGKQRDDERRRSIHEFCTQLNRAIGLIDKLDSSHLSETDQIGIVGAVECLKLISEEIGSSVTG